MDNRKTIQLVPSRLQLSVLTTKVLGLSFTYAGTSSAQQTLSDVPLNSIDLTDCLRAQSNNSFVSV